MTNQEASKVIKDGLEDMSLDFADEEQYEALTMAIKALQEPTDRIEYGTDGNAYKLWISNGKEYEPSGDLISRQAVNTLVDELARAISDERCCMSRGRSTATIMQDILDLPSVKQEPKMGRWKIKDDKEQGYDIGGIKTWYVQIMCDKCGFIKTAIEGHTGQYKFCPNCGARMEAEI